MKFEIEYRKGSKRDGEFVTRTIEVPDKRHVKDWFKAQKAIFKEGKLTRIEEVPENAKER